MQLSHLTHEEVVPAVLLDYADIIEAFVHDTIEIFVLLVALEVLITAVDIILDDLVRVDDRGDP
jgi:hypothetical protein